MNLSLNSIVNSDDPTIIKATYIILDFDVSLNNAIMSKEVGLELGDSIINKPIVANYLPVEKVDTTSDNFTGHEAEMSINKHGKKTVVTNTVPIGVFTTKGYLMTIINENGDEKEVVAADAVLWRSRFSDACELIVEWYNRGIKINTSCEFLYNNFLMQDGVEHINSPVYFEGHCILASEQRGDQGVILPAYDSSRLLSLNDINKFNKMVAQAKRNEESEKMKFKKLFELSHDDIRSKIYQSLDPTLPEDTYSWIREVYDDYFIAQIEGNEYKTYEFKYSKTENEVVVDFESKIEVVEKQEWVKVEQGLQTQLNETILKVTDLEAQVNSTQESLNSLSTEKDEINSKLNEANEKVVIIASEREDITQKFNEATDKLDSLNSKVEELTPYKEKFNEAQFNTALSEKKDFYKAKFSAFSALDKFESEDVQELIKTYALNDGDSESAKIQLNSILVDLVEVKNMKQEEYKFDSIYVRELSSKMENLIPEDTDFDRKYT